MTEIITIRSSYHDTKKCLENLIWQKLSGMTIENVLPQFLLPLNPNTRRTYESSWKSIFLNQVLSPQTILQTLAIANLEAILDQIILVVKGCYSTKQRRGAAFVSFIKYLHRQSKGIIPEVIVPRYFFNNVYTTAHTRSITQAEWLRLLDSLKRRSFRDYLFTKMTLQGAKRVGEIINAKIEDIHWQNNRIKFKQQKARKSDKYTVINYPIVFMEELKLYLSGRNSGYIFITRTGEKLSQPHIYRTLAQASVEAGLKTRVHPHSLRASAITHMSLQGFTYDEISWVSGHNDPKSVKYYDKRNIEENISKKICLI